MHLTLEELLAVRAGEITGERRAHLDACGECAAELASLGALADALRSLPAESPTRDVLPVVSAVARERRVDRRWVLGGWIAAGLAASVTFTVVVRGTVETWQEAKLHHEQRSLLAESQRIEGTLATVAGGRPVNGRAAYVIADIEDRIARIDSRLTQAKGDRSTREVVDLWQERVRLLDALANVRATRVAYVGL